jgi:hypothetical protein
MQVKSLSKSTKEIKQDATTRYLIFYFVAAPKKVLKRGLKYRMGKRVGKNRIYPEFKED